ncbi:LysR family transcriptional regulator [Pseudonocardia adelaidensis]|uniref:LysR family transcriptional regulator n=1 Tax=Pseudonocardia adelaidensis TaxID=648754 RepID=A0ABP9NLP2_9PSEU
MIGARNRSGRPREWRGIELRHLTAFLAVADELNFHRAADRLHIGQPGLSQQIMHLERELGVRLFDRSTRSVHLTQAGEAFYHPVQRVLRELALACSAAARGGASGSVAIGFTRASTPDMMPRLVRAVQEQEPDLRLDLHGSVQATEGLAALRADELDVAFVRDAPRDSEISARIVRLDPLSAMVPDTHPLADRDEIAVADLAAEPFITFPAMRGSAVREALLRSCQEAGFHPRIVEETGDADTMCGLVAAGIGVTLLTTAPSARRFAGIAVRPIAGNPIEIPLLLAWRTDTTSNAVRRVLSIAEEALPSPAGRRDEPT